MMPFLLATAAAPAISLSSSPARRTRPGTDTRVQRQLLLPVDGNHFCRFRSSWIENQSGPVRRVPVSVVVGRDAPSRPGRKAHNCHPSRGAGGVSPEGP